MSQYQVYAPFATAEMTQLLMHYLRVLLPRPTRRRVNSSICLSHTKSDTMEVIWGMMEKLHKRDFEEFSMLGWAIWRHMLSIVHKRNQDVVQRGVLLSCNYLREYQRSLKCMEVEGENNMASSLKCWKSPRVGELRLDVDTSYNEDTFILCWRGVTKS